MSPEALRQLKRRARESGLSQTTLLERYLEEGLRRDVHPLIYFRHGAGGRRAALIGSRLDVWQVVDTVRAAGNSVEDAAAYLDVPAEKVDACLDYYAQYQDEVDEWSARAALVAEREESLWRRRHEALG